MQPAQGAGRAFTVLLALAAGVALADGSIVTLGLPQILDDLDASISGVAAVVGADHGGAGVCVIFVDLEPGAGQPCTGIPTRRCS